MYLQEHQSIGERIRDLRKQQNMTQAVFGGLFDIPQGTLSRIEQGILEPPNDLLLKISKEFDLSEDYFGPSPPPLCLSGDPLDLLPEDIAKDIKENADFLKTAEKQQVADFIRHIIKAGELSLNKDIKKE